MKCRSSCSTSATPKRSSSRSSRTSSAAISIRWRRRAAISSLANEYSHSQEDIAKIVGKSRSHIANTLRLLKLPEKVKAYINSGKLTAGHARMLVGQPNAEELADQIVDQGLNVRQVEAMARESGRAQARRGQSAAGQSGKDADTEALEKRLSDTLGLAVTIDHRANGGGTLQVKYRTLEQLDDVVARLEQGPKLAADAYTAAVTRGRRA